VVLCRKAIGYKVPLNLEAENPEQWQKEEQEKIDSAEPLSEEQLQEKEALLQKGYGDWSRKDFNHFVRACAEFGRDDIDNICKEVEGKDPDEVRGYAEIFWARKDELQDHDRVMSIVEKGESKIQRKKDIRRALSAKMARYRSPFHQLHIVYGTNKGKNYTEEEDRFLVGHSIPPFIGCLLPATPWADLIRTEQHPCVEPVKPSTPISLLCLVSVSFECTLPHCTL